MNQLLQFYLTSRIRFDFSLIVLAVFAGSIPFGLLTGYLLAGIDIRTVGSGNIGATNAARAVGGGRRSKGFAVFLLVFVLDGLKKVAPDAAVHVVPDWPVQEGFIQTLAEPVATTINVWADAGYEPAECALLYVAHSLPMKFIDGGDPYQQRTDLTVTEVHGLASKKIIEAGHATWLDKLDGGPVPRLAYQSRVGPIKWLGPEITAEVQRLADSGVKRLHLQPVSFTCEHIETLMELDIELREDAEKAGITDYHRGASLNLAPVWLDSMARELAAEAFTPEVSSRA